ncbi:LOW QUALITY PROTEIN: sodium-coupled neutral amino acid transporter 9 homolog [Pollicipes pollicipes]|uniref:LOW QUALITY PROTEIN: sodium-coupled neutral amino acid transporter 9 homolog n=1 Tax=Pollicipes pollicipes TaxID=41117 RepID=UPI0018851C22|nr:LOW QUALITY PROTEIN: sodium-coupled neutral amino acid transporter 9 homolog [Pollicipes pollicipes]
MGSSGRLARRDDSETGSEADESAVWEPPHFTIPDHLIPAEFFIPFVRTPRPGEESKNASIITVFAIWNTMMGTSILSMPWLVEQSGFISSMLTFVAMGLVCVFTAYRVLTMQARLRIPPPTHDFQNIMRDVLSKHWEYFGILFSVAVLLGAMLVYWVLMTNFLYRTVDFFYDLAIGNFSKYDVNATVIHGAYCPENVVVEVLEAATSAVGEESFYDKMWNAQTTPLFLVLLLYPLLNIKSPTFFTKFTGMGTISVLYMIIFVTTKSVQFGINVSFTDVAAQDYVQLFRPNFPVAMGTLSLAMFIHNCICRIMESNQHQENNVRDLFIAYFLVFLTYLYIGLLFFVAWPFAKSCIQDNFLDNFLGTDPMSIGARIFLFFQMCTVFPLLGFMIRAQLMTFIYSTTYPGPGRVLALNTAVVIACVAVAVFYPHIGELLRFSGAFCGMAWIFTFPCVTYLVGTYRRGRLRWPAALLHSGLVVLGVVNLILQFVVKTD